ncbi:glycoside/pentoside/hexuronide:cation symporter, GPH family [Sphingomonas sp. OV641]|uniref:MFS transporter n=1 Tax=Sphingomonas sp. OV641 TaxID=1881068 RepID=UPI0008B98C3A|nr:glycoside/pentoside/hexuronide:cation symporter, GPH family [Sphingomonas sp. OV641]
MSATLASTASVRSAPAGRRLRGSTMASYGFGAAAYGVKDSGFGTFLLLFYNQVIGVPAATVGFVIMCALIIDAFVDPTIGFLSDRTRTSWGRRHPWLYGSALPIMLGWVLLWNPPQSSQAATLGWLFVIAVMVRSAVSAYEVPSQAMAAELSSDYDERTRIMAYRYLFGWAGGLVMLIAAYWIFLAPTPEYPNGLLNPNGYKGFAIAGALFMGVAILTSAMGTHREIPNLPSPVIEKQTIGQNFAELGQTLRNKAFLILMAAGLFVYTNQGITYAISNYLYTYVWRFTTVTIAGLTVPTFVPLSMVLFGGVLVAFVLAPRIGQVTSKPKAASTAAVLAIIIGTSPYWARLAGVFPEVGSPAMLPLLFTMLALGTAASVTAHILGASMMADVVEDSEQRTGRRSEGVFFAGGFFIQKCTSGVGIFVTGLILAAANFPAKAVPGQVPVEVLDRLTVIYIVAATGLALVAAALYRAFPFGRAEHTARLEALRMQALDSERVDPVP